MSTGSSPFLRVMGADFSKHAHLPTSFHNHQMVSMHCRHNTASDLLIAADKIRLTTLFSTLDNFRCPRTKLTDCLNKELWDLGILQRRDWFRD